MLDIRSDDEAQPEPAQPEPAEAEADEAEQGTATAEPPGEEAEEAAEGARAKPAKRPRKGPVDELPRWDLVLHNDDVNSMDDVILALTTQTPLSLEVAIRKMVEAHTRGRSILLTTHRERAELYRERLALQKLTASIRKAS